jgi:hypothetical protein
MRNASPRPAEKMMNVNRSLVAAPKKTSPPQKQATPCFAFLYKYERGGSAE